MFDELKKLRNQLAHEENVPAYIIFSDSSLLDLATYLPLTEEDLFKMSGFGTYKVERYGQLFLEKIQDYCNDHQLVSQVALKKPKKKRK